MTHVLIIFRVLTRRKHTQHTHTPFEHYFCITSILLSKKLKKELMVHSQQQWSPRFSKLLPKAEGNILVHIFIYTHAYTFNTTNKTKFYKF
mmetsp:Transcript_20201/g.56168  ORF Transcript_20201/g.56168 Transcript_20201/m.56168 type:complete len:91 (+) Transcript_20201:1410-1682(+)